MRGGAIAMLAVLGALVFSPAAEAACPRTSLLAIQNEVMCVICGVPLVNAGGPQAEDQRDFIRERVDQCESKEQITAALVDEYGTQVLAVPEKSGFDLTAWLVPVIALMAALTAIVVGLARWSRAKPDEPLTDGAIDDDSVDRDLQRYDL